MAGGKGPAFRLKVKAKDGKTFKVVDRDGEEREVTRADVGVVWLNDNGMMTFKFNDPKVETAVCKALGVSGAYFDLFANDGGPKGARKAAPEDDADF